MVDHGTRDSALLEQVLAELKQLRAMKGSLRPESIVQFPSLYGLASQTNAIDCWRWLDEMARSGTRRNHFIEAARLSIFGEGADVLARLTNAGEALERDQRTIRTWSDRGLPELAQTLVDASYLAGSRAMHFVDMQWVPDIASPSGSALRIFWCGHEYLRGEGIGVYTCNPSLTSEEDDFTSLGECLSQLKPTWQELIPIRGAFTVYCRLYLHLPAPSPSDGSVLTFKFGKQSTQFVRITNLPEIHGYTVRASIYRQGVSFWFDRDVGRSADDFDWGAPILIGSDVSRAAGG
ncbi:hypothetical protein [Mycolicibacterium wolinskyi]|uniref:hypothetical protein n=1 Tax=Mycolicibacterium wolinskyi TaxID=59750 RepID=UPI0039177BD9